MIERLVLPPWLRLGLILPLLVLNLWVLRQLLLPLAPFPALFIGAALIAFLLDIPTRWLHGRGLPRGLAVLLVVGLGLGLPPGLSSARADVVFQNCVPVAGGGITCDTRPEGNTLMNDEAARYGLLDQASPGWDEFEPYQGYDDMFGGNET